MRPTEQQLERRLALLGDHVDLVHAPWCFGAWVLWAVTRDYPQPRWRPIALGLLAFTRRAALGRALRTLEQAGALQPPPEVW